MSDYTEHDGCMGRLFNRRKAARKEYQGRLHQAQQIGGQLRAVADHIDQTPTAPFSDFPRYPPADEVRALVEQLRALKIEIDDLNARLDD